MEERTTAGNGINIYSYKQPHTHSICISLYVKAGVLYESEPTGITHFLEHLHFRKLGGRTQKELYYELESIGANFGACTYKEFVQFYLTSSPKYFSVLSKIASDLLGALEADAKDFTAEKRIILSEIREADHKNDVDVMACKYIWEATNLQNTILGSVKSIKNLSLDMLQAEKERVFTKQGAFYYVTGCFEDDDIKMLKSDIERYKMDSRKDNRYENAAQIPQSFMKRSAFAKVLKRTSDLHDVKISFDVDFSKVSRYDLLYLDSVLSEGLCSLLRAEMIEKKGLIYSFVSTLEQYNNIGIYHFNFSVYKSKLYDTLKSFVSVINKAKQGISEADMQTVRVFKTDNQLQLLDDPEALNWTFAYENHILQNSYSDIAELSGIYMNITKEQLDTAANAVFVPDNAMIISMGNNKGISEARLHEILSEI